MVGPIGWCMMGYSLVLPFLEHWSIPSCVCVVRDSVRKIMSGQTRALHVDRIKEHQESVDDRRTTMTRELPNRCDILIPEDVTKVLVGGQTFDLSTTSSPVSERTRNFPEDSSFNALPESTTEISTGPIFYFENSFQGSINVNNLSTRPHKRDGMGIIPTIQTETTSSTIRMSPGSLEQKQFPQYPQNFQGLNNEPTFYVNAAEGPSVARDSHISTMPGNSISSDGDRSFYIDDSMKGPSTSKDTNSEEEERLTFPVTNSSPIVSNTSFPQYGAIPKTTHRQLDFDDDGDGPRIPSDRAHHTLANSPYAVSPPQKKNIVICGRIYKWVQKLICLRYQDSPITKCWVTVFLIAVLIITVVGSCLILIHF